MAWTPKYVKWLYNKFGRHLRPTYEKIDSWDLPEWIKNASNSIWDKLDGELKKKLYDFAVVVCKKYDANFAKDLLEKIWKRLKDKLS